jgi:hypothetical protein
MNEAGRRKRGGFRWVRNPDFDTTYLEASIWTIDSKRDGTRKWTSAGHNFGDAAGERVSFAYCGKSEPQLKARSLYGLDFTLLADPDHEVAEAYGAWGEKSPT